MLYSNVSALPGVRDRMLDVIERRASPFDSLPVGWAVRCFAGAALRGRWRLVREMIDTAKKGMIADRELRARKKLLALAVATAEGDAPLATPEPAKLAA